MPTPICPSCSASLLLPATGEELICSGCSTELLLCRSCRKPNLAEADSCANCGEPLSVFSQVLDRQLPGSRARFLEQARSLAPELKDREAQASAGRMAQLMDIDRQRIEAAQLAVREQQLKEQRLLKIGLATAALFILAILAAFLLIAVLGG